jgi:hypothetical protein
MRVLFSILVLFLVAAAAPAMPIDLELVLAVDVSRSIDEEEYGMQKDGYAAAVASAAVVNAIRSGPRGAIAVTYVEWSGSAHQRQLVAWTLINDAASAQSFADQVRRAPRGFADWTAIGAAIDFSAALFDGNGYEGDRLVIDISGDGASNNGRPPHLARDDAVARGIAINGLPILNEQSKLDEYYQDNVIGGPGSFIVPADDFASFGRALVAKLVREIAALPNARRLAGEP